MYKSSVAFASSHQTETLQLVKWMKAMNLDFQNEAKLRSVDPVEMMVRGSLGFGVNVIIDIRLPDTRFDHGKRVVELSYSSEQESWLLRRRYIIKQTNLNDYAYLFLLSGLRLQDCYVYAGKVLGYEEQLRQMEAVTVNVTHKQFIRIEDLGHHTTPYVTESRRNHWSYFALIAEHTFCRKTVLRMLS
ncbi:uncharacterized protein LOC142802935 [Rhipicephalus microplus]|uniref:uncharacterized protein LOC142802935 n=1 Tax=Rhipicephalus microplus TaxID=6941 RepID=UPI003F6B368E